MSRVVESVGDFSIIGENIHASRIVLRNGRRSTTLESGIEAVTFTGETGENMHLRVPESFKETQPYQQGHIKHFMIAMHKGISDDLVEQTEGADYIAYEVRRQVKAGSHFLDVNVDELSYKLEIQKSAMRWLVRTVQKVSPVPLSVDSSNPEIIASGLSEYDDQTGRPMINSVALERLETLDLVKEHNARVIVTAAGADGMPQNTEERVVNINKVMEAAQAAGIPLSDIYIDCLLFPIAVDPRNGNSFLDTVRSIREKYGKEVHITGGLSNVSFGLPKRKLVNDTFIYLSLEAGIDSGIIDPVQSKIEDVFNLKTDTEAVGYAQRMLLGEDEYCVDYIKAYRNGKLTTS